MRTFHALVPTALLCLPLAIGGCGVGDTGTLSPGGQPDAGEVIDMTDADVTGTAQLSGDITQNAALGGTVELVADATIMSGVHVTIAPGTAFTGAQNTVLRVEGTLEIAGTADEPITIHPAEGAGGWGGVVVEAGGSASVSYVTGAKVATLVYCKEGALHCSIDRTDFSDLGKAMQTYSSATITNSHFNDMSNGAISVGAGGDLSITDTYVWTSSHDLIVSSGGSITLDHVEVGGALTSYEHCDLHFGSADSLTVKNSNIVSAIYGMMIANTTNAVIQYNNFMDNNAAQDVAEVGPNTGVDLRYNYWSQGAPDLGADYDTSSPAAAPIDGSGPRIPPLQ